MHDASSIRSARLRAAVFVVCAGCTLWLLVQNAILLSLVSWDRLPLPLAHAGLVLRVVAGAAVLIAVVPVAFGLGWLGARNVQRARAQGGLHE